ncbi:hypothetical protein EVG20_g877 [Dentipellis fragilis]|uniref:Proteophosphoglycan ppg4 n=1 Tax=Dentipellis fragilis TaxID=205917 RepID=A0A4Y9ZE75_9AGAM|nr:hypothetical protein EVG20_g877 [Dentipellis fragilis]
MYNLLVLTQRTLHLLAYYSNPSETSFRSYLTEQSFRHHLSRLHDAPDGDHTDSEDFGIHYTSKRSTSGPSSHSDALDACSPSFPFSNRASVALRTSKHAFHSFGFFTIAAVIPNNFSGRSSSPSSQGTSRSSSTSSSGLSELARRSSASDSDLDDSSHKESWFIGAFGRWWRGGVIEASWPNPSDGRAKCDEEAWSSGILNIKALDKLDGYSGLPFPTTTSPRSPRASPPKLRSRDRSAPRTSRRNSTPPPLPKSATLPLHTPKHLSSAHSAPKPPQPHTVHAAPPLSSPIHSRTPSSTNVSAYTHTPHSSLSAQVNTPSAGSVPCTPFDTHPAIAEILSQINHARNATHDLRAQLDEHSTNASSVDASLVSELAEAKDTKRVEDAGRGELKSRLKGLEESKRVAEAGKREAEKKLRMAKSVKMDASARVEKLVAEIEALTKQHEEDQRATREREAETEREAKELGELLERKKQEVGVAENVVAALGARVKDLEQQVEKEQDLLKAAKERAELLQQDRKFLSLTVVKPQDDDRDHALPVPPTASEQVIFDTKTEELAPVPDIFPTAAEKEFPHISSMADRDSSSGSSGTGGGLHSREVSASPRARQHSLLTTSNLVYTSLSSNGKATSPVSANYSHPEALARRAKGYSIFDDDIASLSQPAPTTTFAPFDNDSGMESGDDTHNVKSSNAVGVAGQRASVPMAVSPSSGAFSPAATALIPNSLIRSLESANTDGVPKSFQSDSDAFLERDWRHRQGRASHDGSTLSVGTTALNTSPVSLTAPAFPTIVRDDEDSYDPFEVRPPPPAHPLQHHYQRQRLISDPINLQRVWPSRTNSDPISPGYPSVQQAPRTPETQQAEAKTRRWWSASTSSVLTTDRTKATLADARERKGLNPDAKVFRFSRKPAFAASLPLPLPAPALPSFDVPVFDSLNPSSSFLPPSPGAPAPLFSSSGLAMRAFAPSPEEREALQRALGSSTNTSLERLPSLSEVGSMPASPSHTQAHAHTHTHGGHGMMSLELGAGTSARRPSWLANLTAPRGGKMKFSPWEDGEGDEGKE